ncbi:MAG: hypothetical protein KAI24_18830 [Planctomycetes bacterium]|nr:hypothetical protein [Planctomycetota bacterium]
MLIGQTVLLPTDAATYYSPWFPRQGEGFTAVLEVLMDSTGAYTFKCDVETKNAEDADSSVGTPLGNTTASGTGTTTVSVTGCLELVRFKFTAQGTSALQWVHYRMNAPIWQPN